MLLKNRPDDARKSLAWLRGWVPIERIEDEFRGIQAVLKKLPSESVSVNSSVSKQRCGLVIPYTKKSFLVPYALVTLTYVVLIKFLNLIFFIVRFIADFSSGTSPVKHHYRLMPFR